MGPNKTGVGPRAETSAPKTCLYNRAKLLPKSWYDESAKIVCIT